MNLALSRLTASPLIYKYPQAINSPSRERDQEKLSAAIALPQIQVALGVHSNSILRLAISYLRNHDDAEDVLQDTFLQLLRAAPVFESLEHQKAWLLRVAINLCKNRLKYNKRRTWEVLSDALEQHIPEDLSFVWEAVDKLPKHYREVVHLFYQEDLSTKVIARLLNKKESTIRSLLHRARIQLKTHLKEVYDLEK